MSNGSSDDLTAAAAEAIKKEIMQRARGALGQGETTASASPSGAPLRRAEGLERVTVHKSRLYTPVGLTVGVGGTAAIAGGETVANVLHSVTHFVPVAGTVIDAGAGIAAGTLIGGYVGIKTWQASRKMQKAAQAKVQREGLA